MTPDPSTDDRDGRGARQDSDSERCTICNEPIPEEYGKFDPMAPVYADEYVYHLGCEDGIFEEVYARV